jgi:hypothetical protein
MRYVSAERSIAAAGAAFACAEDDSAWIVKARPKSLFKDFVGAWRGAMWRALLVTGLVIV